MSSTLLRALTTGLSASVFVVNAPSGSTITRGSLVPNIPAASKVPGAKLFDVMLVCIYDSWISNSHRPICMVPNACCCCCLNFCSSSTVASHTLSPMSFKSPYVRVIGSRDVLLALEFFCGPTFSGSLVSLTWNRVASGSAPPLSN